MTAIADRLAKPKFGRKRDATSFILRIWIIPGFLLKADLAQLALPNRQVVRRPGVVGPAMDRTLPKLRCQVKSVKRLDGGSFRRCGRTAAVGAAGPRSSEERRVGKECVRTCGVRGSP